MKFSSWMKLREEKDACYHKVKSRFRVFPSAYASGALVQCRKKGAKNWGNSKKMHKEQNELNETLKDKKQFNDAMQAAMALHYKGIDPAKSSTKDIKDALQSIGRQPPEGTSLDIFAARVKAVSTGSVESGDFKEGTFDLEKERGLKGWFDRNNGKGWIDCKASKKGKLVACGRKKAGRGAERKYPACRPTLSACNRQGKKRKKSSKRISWKKFSEWLNDN